MVELCEAAGAKSWTLDRILYGYYAESENSG
jgi:hypothetical protein